uniref:Uncharacterized protein n=1 Tax=Setaria italica TaxID=4555 RepID=A0A0Q3SXE7_SETIT
DANASPVDAALVRSAALARRREELLLELNKARIRQDMIFRELVETELAMGITATSHNPVPALPSPQDYWLNRPLSSSQKPEQPRLGNGDEQKARVHAFNGYMELCLSPSKQAPVEEISVPVAAKADISPMQSALSFGEAAATGPQQAFGGEPKANLVDAHGMQGDIRNQSSGQRKAMESAMEGRTDKPAQPPDQHRPAGQEGYGEECKADAEDGQGVHSLYQSGNQSSGKRKTLETTLADQINGPMLLSDRLAGQESASFDQQKGREFSELKPEQPRLGNEDEQKARLHASNGYMELCLSPSKQAPVEETLVPVAAKANNSPMQSALSFGGGNRTPTGL